MRRLLLATSLLIVACAISVPGGAHSRGHDLAEGLIAHLGLGEFGEKLEAGGVVYSGLLGQEQLKEEVSAVGAMLLVRGVPPEVVIDAFLHPDTFRDVHGIGRHGALPDTEGITNAFEELMLDPEFDMAGLARDPLREYNLGERELSLFPKTHSTVDRKAVRNAWHSILKGRLESYLAGGISQIAPYLRKKGGKVSPARELSAALHASTYLEHEFPRFVDSLIEPSKPYASEFDQEYFWLETDFNGQRVWALSVEQRLMRSDVALGADLHFYASRGYNSMLTFIGVVPYGEHSLVFAVNHTFTDEVLGFGSGVRKRVARSRVSETLAGHLEAVRRQIE